MRKQLFVLSVALILLIVLSVFTLSKPNTDRVPATNGKAKEPVPVIIPAHAVEIADNVFSLGTARDVDGSVVEGIMIIDKKENAKPPWAGGGGGGSTTTCFSFLATGAKWKTIELWVVNPTNTEGLDSGFVQNNVVGDIQKWEDASSTNILGDGGTTSVVLVADQSSPDGVNEIYFGDVDSAGAIAVTIVWGIFSGPPKIRKLV